MVKPKNILCKLWGDNWATPIEKRMDWGEKPVVDFSVSDMPVVIFPYSASDVNLIGISLRTVFGSYLPIQHCQASMMCSLF